MYESVMQIPPTINALNTFDPPNAGSSHLYNNVIGITAPLTKLGTVFVAVERILVPNCSEAIVTNNAQNPVPAPNKKHMQ